MADCLLPGYRSQVLSKNRRILFLSPALFLFVFIIHFSKSEAGGAGPDFSSAFKMPSAETGGPIHLQADRLEYLRESDTYIAEGNVIAQQGTLHLEADSIHLDNLSGKLSAKGNVHLTDGENKTDAEAIVLDINTQLGILYQGRLFIKSENYSISGEEIERRSVDRYYLKKGTFTACDCPEEPDWQVRARRMRVQLDQYLVARDVVFYADEIPIFYLPFIVYPVKTGRQTGLLIPRVGYSSRDGFRYNQDLYWAIAQNQDATVTINHRGRRGDGGGLEYRYAFSAGSRGRFNTDYLFDRINQVGRWEVRYNHQQRFSERIDFKIDLRYLNEENTLQELSDRTIERAQQNIESNLFVTYRGEEVFAYLLARYTQSLTGLSNDTTAQRLPEIGYHIIEHRVGSSSFLFDFEGTAVNFWRQEGLRAARIDLYPKLSRPIQIDAATLTPWIGFRETWYSRGAADERSIGRGAIPSGVMLESPLHRSWGRLTHLLTPSVQYEYIAVEDRTDIPQFDELDQIHDRNSVTLSLLQRFYKTGEKQGLDEKAAIRLTETYRFGEPDAADAAGFQRYSDLRGEILIRPYSFFSIDIDSFYHWREGRFTAWNTDLNLGLGPYVIATVGQRYTRGGTLPRRGDLFNPSYLGDRESVPKIEFWTERVVIKTPWGINLANRIYYDADQKRFVEIDYGIQYEDQCWSVTLAYLDLQTRNEFSFMISLKGLGQTASRKFADLF